MKRFKGYLELIKNLIIFFVFGFWWLWALLLIIFVAYQIAVSDLPDWFKFFLLR